MRLDDILGPPVTLGEFVLDPNLLPGWAWLYAHEPDTIEFSTICRATAADSRELSEEECDARDATLEGEGFVCLLSREQIESVIANLLHRHPDPTREQLEAAVSFYLDHDAFIVT